MAMIGVNLLASSKADADDQFRQRLKAYADSEDINIAELRTFVGVWGLEEEFEKAFGETCELRAASGENPTATYNLAASKRLRRNRGVRSSGYVGFIRLRPSLQLRSRRLSLWKSPERMLLRSLTPL
jgi:hypothetical protein